jgi:hypothetical protein
MGGFMPRLWNNDERTEQSMLTMKRQPWQHSSGPKSEGGKARVRKNSMKTGYYSKFHRESRKVKRSTKARHIESAIRSLGKEKDDDKFLELVDQILNELDDYSNALSSPMVMEGVYLNSLVLAVINNSIFSRINRMMSKFPEYSEKLKTA